MAPILAYVAAAVVAVWGVLHAVPTRRVLAGFAPITADNRRIVLQEWLAEAFTMWGVAAVVFAATATGGPDADVRAWVYRIAAALLAALGGLTALTGARTRRDLVQGLPGTAGRLGRAAARRQHGLDLHGQICTVRSAGWKYSQLSICCAGWRWV